MSNLGSNPQSYQPKPKPDLFTALLGVALLAILIGIGFLLAESSAIGGTVARAPAVASAPATVRCAPTTLA